MKKKKLIIILLILVLSVIIGTETYAYYVSNMKVNVTATGSNIICDAEIKEVSNEDQVPENIKEKIESNEEAKASGTKTFVNGKIYDKADQFINDCKALKRSRIGSHRVIVGDTNMAKKIKSKLTNAENEFVKFYKDLGHDPDRLSCINFMDCYFIWVNEYIKIFDCYCDTVSSEETDAIINKYFDK